MKMIATLAPFSAALVLATAGAAIAEDSKPAYDLGKLYGEIRQIVRRHYPQATTHVLNDTIHFEHDTRLFIVHEPLKTGEWQDP